MEHLELGGVFFNYEVPLRSNHEQVMMKCVRIV